jgi:LPS O-antigen subunit length determinant protein (WzzB/FepE family)
MRRWIGLASNLYPWGWRKRYGEEFDALLEDVNPGWREFTDVLRGALKMQMTNATGYLKLIGGLAVAGAIVATALSFRVPRTYESTAVFRVAEPPNQPSLLSQDALWDWLLRQLGRTDQEILSRASLEGLITRPDLDLYKEDRLRDPMEDIVMRMRAHIWISIAQLRSPESGSALKISFSSTDPRKAQAVVWALTNQFIDKNWTNREFDANAWQKIWPQSSLPGFAVELLNPGNLPEKPTSPNRLAFAAIGLALGLALGLFAVIAMRRPKWTLQMAGFAAACCAIAVALSFLLPQTYTSTAVMRIPPPLVPASLTREIAAPPPVEKLQRLEEVVLSRTSLEGLITQPALDLYKEDRSRLPMEDIVRRMRNRDIRIRVASAAPRDPRAAAFLISFSYPDPEKAQAVVRDLVARFTEENIADERALARASGDAKAIEIAEHQLGVNLEVLNPPSHSRLGSPSRVVLSSAGFAFGLLLGAITLYFRRNRGETLQIA